ncbi:integrase core domain-containing protein, partial [Salinicola sp. MIT1003]|uniref:integrase core domain-containing protein n=1 Tax=Salinicola sp. MIT1003 TaxID=1882734 RepID=UPI001FFC3F2E
SGLCGTPSTPGISRVGCAETRGSLHHCPQQNGMVESLIRTLKEQCVHRHRFETLQHAMRVIGDWVQFYNHRRPHQALGMKTPAEAYARACELAA